MAIGFLKTEKFDAKEEDFKASYVRSRTGDCKKVLSQPNTKQAIEGKQL
jgi:hypothetical protein